jgi:hypothetical protein
MSRRRETPHQAALRELLEEARRSGESRSAARRHHLVPAFYLSQWADEGKIRVTDVNESRSWITTPKRAASETDYYRVEAPDIDPDQVPPLLFEVAMSKAERWGADFIAAALDDPAAVISDEQRVLFSIYMAFQYVRGRSYRTFAHALATELFNLQYGEITNEGIRRLLLERGSDPNPEQVTRVREFVDQLNRGDVTIRPDQPSVISMSGKSVEQIGLHLFARGWRMYRVPRLLLTCDEPVIPIAGPPHSRDERGGVGNAGVVIFPLAPDLLLAMFDGINARPPRGDELGCTDIAEINREIVAASSTYAFERPSRRVAAAFDVPKTVKEIVRETLVPADGSERRLIRTQRPSRWANQTHAPPWPVERWWTW